MDDDGRQKQKQQTGRQAGRQAADATDLCRKVGPHSNSRPTRWSRKIYLWSQLVFPTWFFLFFFLKRSNGLLWSTMRTRSEKGARKRRKKRRDESASELTVRTQVQKNEKTIGGGAPLLSGTGTISFSLPPPEVCFLFQSRFRFSNLQIYPNWQSDRRGRGGQRSVGRAGSTGRPVSRERRIRRSSLEGILLTLQ